MERRQDEWFTMRDGIRLLTDLYVPASRAPQPALLIRTPYGKSDAAGYDAEGLTRAGFVVAVQEVRGTGDSEGQFVPFDSDGEDGYDSVELLATDPACDGRVVMMGGSYLGIVQWAAAATRPPSLVGISPASTPSTFFQGLPYVGDGVLALEPAVTWAIDVAVAQARRLGVAADVDGAVDPGVELQRRPRARARGWDEFAPWFADWLAHDRADDPYWKVREPRAARERTQVPTLQFTAWWDGFAVGAFDHFASLHASNPGRHRLVVGPGDHAAACGIQNGVLVGTCGDVRFFDDQPQQTEAGELLTWANGVLTPGTAPAPAPLRLYICGAETWRDEFEWPLARTAWTAMFLGATEDSREGTLAIQPPEQQRELSYVHDPTMPVPDSGGSGIGLPGQYGPRLYEPSGRSDILMFCGPQVEADLEVTGPISAHLWMSSDAPVFDLVVSLMDVDPDGTILCVSRGLFSAGAGFAADLNPVTVELGPMSWIFKQGHGIRVQVASSCFPTYDVCPGTAVRRNDASEQDLRPSFQRLRMGGTTPSRIVLPCIPGELR